MYYIQKGPVMQRAFPIHDVIMRSMASPGHSSLCSPPHGLMASPTPCCQFHGWPTINTLRPRQNGRPWWHHQMETFSALLAICAGNSPVPVNSPHKGQWRGALMFTLICARINGWVNNREAGDLRRYRAHYDVIVMTFSSRHFPMHFLEWKCLNFECNLIKACPIGNKTALIQIMAWRRTGDKPLSEAMMA